MRVKVIFTLQLFEKLIRIVGKFTNAELYKVMFLVSVFVCLASLIPNCDSDNTRFSVLRGVIWGPHGSCSLAYSNA